MIEEEDVTVYICYDTSECNNQTLLEKVRVGKATRKDFRQLGKYAVSVPAYLIKTLRTEQVGETAYVLAEAERRERYDERYGLKVY